MTRTFCPFCGYGAWGRSLEVPLPEHAVRRVRMGSTGPQTYVSTRFEDITCPGSGGLHVPLPKPHLRKMVARRAAEGMMAA